SICRGNGGMLCIAWKAAALPPWKAGCYAALGKRRLRRLGQRAASQPLESDGFAVLVSGLLRSPWRGGFAATAATVPGRDKICSRRDPADRAAIDDINDRRPRPSRVGRIETAKAAQPLLSKAASAAALQGRAAAALQGRASGRFPRPRQ